MLEMRKHKALSIDGGGIRAIAALGALAVIEEHYGKPLNQVFGLFGGTSTGSIVAAALAMGKRVGEIHDLYVRLAQEVFVRRKMSYINPLTSPVYGSEALRRCLRDVFGKTRLGSLGTPEQLKRGEDVDLLITTRDMIAKKMLFVKPWKPQYATMPLWYWTLCSCSAPTYFKAVDGRYVDGGVGKYNNPCFITAIEAITFLKWVEEETTLVSLGTGRYQDQLDPGEMDDWNQVDWAHEIIDGFYDESNGAQVNLVNMFFPKLDFRRYQIDIDKIALDDVDRIKDLEEYGKVYTRLVTEDRFEPRVLPTLL